MIKSLTTRAHDRSKLRACLMNIASVILGVKIRSRHLEVAFLIIEAICSDSNIFRKSSPSKLGLFFDVFTGYCLGLW